MKPILNIENLTKVYGTLPNQTRALNGITFQVMPGEFLGIMGSSGSGKSTLLNCIATVIQPTGGSIQVEGDTLQSLKEKALAEYRGKEVGYLFQNFELLDNLTGRENILLPTSMFITEATVMVVAPAAAAAVSVVPANTAKESVKRNIECCCGCSCCCD